MKFKDDPWLTDYINAVHFAIRYIETQTRDRVALYRLKQETDALIQEAILGNIPMEIMTMQRLARRIRRAEHNLLHPAISAGPPSDPPVFLKSFSGNTAGLVSDFRFICQGLTEFSRKEITAECDLYFSKIYPNISKMEETVEELIRLDTEAGLLVEIGPEVFRHSAKNQV
ncbi:MAG: hypothetical protein R2941_24075 [Desulfobacterales bacterium]